MKTIEYLPTGHIFQMPDEDADALLKKFPESYRIHDAFVRCEFVHKCEAQCDGAIENTEICDSYSLHRKLEALDSENTKYKESLQKIKEVLSKYQLKEDMDTIIASPLEDCCKILEIVNEVFEDD